MNSSRNHDLFKNIFRWGFPNYKTYISRPNPNVLIFFQEIGWNGIHKILFKIHFGLDYQGDIYNYIICFLSGLNSELGRVDQGY